MKGEEGIEKQKERTWEGGKVQKEWVNSFFPPSAATLPIFPIFETQQKGKEWEKMYKEKNYRVEKIRKRGVGDKGKSIEKEGIEWGSGGWEWERKDSRRRVRAVKGKRGKGGEGKLGEEERKETGCKQMKRRSEGKVGKRGEKGRKGKRHCNCFGLFTWLKQSAFFRVVYITIPTCYCKIRVLFHYHQSHHKKWKHFV